MVLAPVVALEEASGVIANGYLRLDREEWIRAVEKRPCDARGSRPRRTIGGQSS
jgi:hypothetical protein